MDSVVNIDLLPEVDREFLRAKGYKGEVVNSGGGMHLILSGIPLSAIYSVRSADLLIKIPAGYPNANPDMFWTHPVITFTNGTLPPATESRETHHGKEWQRWSRHYTANAWRPGIDGLESFLRLIVSEFSKNTP